MRRLATVIAVGAALTALWALPAVAKPTDTVKKFNPAVTLGFYRGQTVSYFDLGPVKLARGNKVAPIWGFTNGAEGQRNVIDTVPGQKSYTPLWAVNMVTWADGATPRVLRSAAAVRKALAAGEVTTARPGIVVNCPVL